MKTATPETVLLPDSPSLVGKEELPGKVNIEEEQPEVEHPAAFHVVSPIQVQSELGTPTQEFGESHPLCAR